MSDIDFTKRYLREKEVAKMLNISMATLQKHRQKRIGLPSTRLAGIVLYSYDEIVAYLNKNNRNVADDAA